MKLSVTVVALILSTIVVSAYPASMTSMSNDLVQLHKRDRKAKYRQQGKDEQAKIGEKLI